MPLSNQTCENRKWCRQLGAGLLGRGCDEMKHISVKRQGFLVKRGRHSVNEGFGKDSYRKGSSVKRSRPFSEPPDYEN